MIINIRKNLIGILLLSIFVFSLFFLKSFFKKKPDLIRITFREGINIHEIADLLQQNGIVQKGDFFKACDSESLKDEFEFLKNESKSKYFALEGYLFPDTYDFVKNEDPILVLKKFLKNFESKIKKVRIPSEFSLEQILIIASVLEAESTLEDGPMVSSVIHNRIKTFESGGKNKFGEYGFKRLQLESTMYYPYRSKDECPPDFKSAYNTYEIEGFPPGPINSPGLKFIIDAINPAQSDYFYFCNDKDGKIYFAKSFKDHVNILKKINKS